MSLIRLHLVDFRVFTECTLVPDPEGTTVLTGPNGVGKTSVLEAIAYLGTQRSFRGAPREAMVRTGSDRAVLRAELVDRDLPVLVEAELAVAGRSRAQVNRQPVRARRDLAAAVPVTVFSPDDLGVVQGGPGRRRDLLDDALRLFHPATAGLLDDVDRILRQRGALLRQAVGAAHPGSDRIPRRLGRAPGHRRRRAGRGPRGVGRSGPSGGDGGLRRVGRRADGPGASPSGSRYRRSWTGPLAAALAEARRDDLRRSASTVGPHRDDLVLAIAGRDARLQASQGEQRCLALALRLGIHQLVTERAGAPPLLLLDDVFSELDPDRSRALVHELPAGQALLTTAVPLPEGVSVASTLDVRQMGTRTGGTGA